MSLLVGGARVDRDLVAALKAAAASVPQPSGPPSWPAEMSATDFATTMQGAILRIKEQAGWPRYAVVIPQGESGFALSPGPRAGQPTAATLDEAVEAFIPSMLAHLSPAAASGAPAICLVHVSHACGITAHQPAHERAAEPGVLCAHPDVCRHALTQTIAWRPACADPTKLPSHLRRPRGSPRDQGARKIGLRARQVDNPTEFSVSTGQRSAGARWCNRGVHSWHANLYATMSKSSMSEGPIPAVASFESAARREFRSRSSA